MKNLIAVLVVMFQIACSTKDVEQKEFITACQAEIKDRMKSPSTYKFFKASFSKSKVSLEEWDKEYKLTGSQKEAFATGSLAPMKYWANIEFEQANFFGTPTKQSAECIYSSTDGLDDLTHETKRSISLKVDGFTKHELMVRSVLGK